MRYRLLLFCLLPWLALAQTPPAATLLRPAAVFDGQDLHPGWAVLVENGKITAAGPAAQLGGPGRRARPGAARPHAAAGPHRRALAPAAAPLQRNALERPGAARSRWPCAWPAPRCTPSARCWPASPPPATWARKAPATPTWA
ncbi:MAG: hypothetical protein WKG07_29470 [Hymenobacter sp.]